MNYKLITILVIFLTGFVNMQSASSIKSKTITKLSENEDIYVGKKKTKIKEKKESTEKKEKKKEPPPEKEYEPVLIGALLENPAGFLSKKIKFRGRFSSFTTLALDYGPALRKSKDYISLCIFRQDSNIPLSELKLAYPVKEAKEDPVIPELEEGDLLEIYGQVFSAALDEPWVDIIYLKKISSAKKSTKEATDQTEEKQDEGKDKRE